MQIMLVVNDIKNILVIKIESVIQRCNIYNMPLSASASVLQIASDILTNEINTAVSEYDGLPSITVRSLEKLEDVAVALELQSEDIVKISKFKNEIYVHFSDGYTIFANMDAENITPSITKTNTIRDSNDVQKIPDAYTKPYDGMPLSFYYGLAATPEGIIGWEYNNPNMVIENGLNLCSATSRNTKENNELFETLGVGVKQLCELTQDPVGFFYDLILYRSENRKIISIESLQNEKMQDVKICDIVKRTNAIESIIKSSIPAIDKYVHDERAKLKDQTNDVSL